MSGNGGEGERDLGRTSLHLMLHLEVESFEASPRRELAPQPARKERERIS